MWDLGALLGLWGSEDCCGRGRAAEVHLKNSEGTCSALEVTQWARGSGLRELLGELRGDCHEDTELAPAWGFGREYVTRVVESYKDRGRRAAEVAVVGAQGVGKSSLINALRGLPHDDPLAAPVGIVETTMQTARYHDGACTLADHGGIVYVDNPGHTTDGVATADIVLIVSCTRFTPFDRVLMARCAELRKPCLLARTKVDLDVLNERHSRPGAWARGEVSEESVLAAIRAEVRAAGRCPRSTPGREEPREFLVNSQTGFMSTFDLAALREHIGRCLPLAKSLEYLRTVALASGEVVERRRQALHDDSKIWSHVCAIFFGALPIPVLGSAANLGCLAYWKDYLSVEFGCDEAALQRLRGQLAVLGVEAEEIAQVKSVVAFGMTCDCADAAMLSGSLACCNSKVLLPGIGSAMQAVASLVLVRWAVRALIDKFAGLAAQLQQLVVEGLRLRELGFEVWAADGGAERYLVPTMDGALRLAQEGPALHLTFEPAAAGGRQGSFGRLTTRRNLELSLCMVTVGSERRLSLCVPCDLSEPRRRRSALWRRRAIRHAGAAWLWVFETEEPRGVYLAHEGSELVLAEVAEGALLAEARAHFALRPPRIEGLPSFCFA